MNTTTVRLVTFLPLASNGKESALSSPPNTTGSNNSTAKQQQSFDGLLIRAYFKKSGNARQNKRHSHKKIGSAAGGGSPAACAGNGSYTKSGFENNLQKIYRKNKVFSGCAASGAASRAKKEGAGHRHETDRHNLGHISRRNPGQDADPKLALAMKKKKAMLLLKKKKRSMLSSAITPVKSPKEIIKTEQTTNNSKYSSSSSLPASKSSTDHFPRDEIYVAPQAPLNTTQFLMSIHSQEAIANRSKHYCHHKHSLTAEETNNRNSEMMQDINTSGSMFDSFSDSWLADLRAQFSSPAALVAN